LLQSLSASEISVGAGQESTWMYEYTFHRLSSPGK
jgi:hypothetical protein